MSAASDRLRADHEAMKAATLTCKCEGRGFVVEAATGRAIECKACLAVRKSVLCARAAERKAAKRRARSG